MKLQPPEILGVSLALATAMISFVWFGCFAPRPKTIESESDRNPSLSKAYQKPNYTVRAPVRAPWTPPPVQSRSGQWVYDVFTPPEIFYDVNSGQFTVTPPFTNAPDGQPDEPDLSGELLAGVQVVDVKQSLFRLQLIGYMKSHDDCIGVFENRETGEVLLAPKGRELPGLGLVIESIDLRHGESLISGSTDVFGTWAVASIRDSVTGELIALNTAERCLGSTARATLVASNPSPIQREVGEGDMWEIDGVTYLIDTIQVSPAAVVLKRRDSARSEAERFTLTWRSSEPAGVSVPSL